MRSRSRWLMVAGTAMALAPSEAMASEPADEEDPTFVDPRRRQIPPTHRFRLGIEFAYMKLSSAIDADSGEKQRFHYIPMLADFAYQAQFLKYMMVRPSLGFGTNVGNTLEAMPLVIHPQLHLGYQGSMFGAAFGYGFFQPLIQRKDVVSASRGGLGEPLIVNNHHVGGEVSFQTRVDRGALSIILRVAGVRSHLQHFELDKPKSWRAMITLNIGWYFGDGSKQRARQRARRAQRASGEPG